MPWTRTKKPNIDQLLREDIRGEKSSSTGSSRSKNGVAEVDKLMKSAQTNRRKIKFVYSGRMNASSLINTERCVEFYTFEYS